MLVADLVAAMEAIAPLDLAEAWDNVGLLVGDASRVLRGPVLLAIDLTDAVLDEATAMRAGAIVAYHPPIFSPLKRLTAASAGGARLLRLIEQGIAVYSPHTALDAAPEGLGDWLIGVACGSDSLASASGSLMVANGAISPARALDENQTHKIVVFVPREASARVRDAMAAAGAGVIGHYEQCSFALEGTGTFRGDAAANPAVGVRGRFESVEEVRLEMVCGEAVLPAVVAALRGAHPYEEPALDVFARAAVPRAGVGAGRIATLGEPTAVDEIARRLKSRLPSSWVNVAAPEMHSPRSTQRTLRESKERAGAASNPPVLSVSSVCSVVHRVAAVPGSGGSLLDAAIDAGAECFITGEMKHHEVLSAVDRGCAVILAGHTETERGYLATLARRLNAIDEGIGARVSAADAPPLRAV